MSLKYVKVYFSMTTISELSRGRQQFPHGAAVVTVETNISSGGPSSEIRWSVLTIPTTTTTITATITAIQQQHHQQPDNAVVDTQQLMQAVKEKVRLSVQCARP